MKIGNNNVNTNFKNFFNNSTLDIRLSYIVEKLYLEKVKLKIKKLAIQKYKEKKEVYDL